MTTLWFDPASCPIRWSAPTVLAVDPLLAGLAARLDGRDLDPAARRRSEAVLFDLLEPIAADLLDLPLPADDRARAVADRLRADPADGRTLGVGPGRRGERPDADAGLRRRHGADVPPVAHPGPHPRRAPPAGRGGLGGGRGPTVGYATASAFGAAFRRVLGTTPSAYLGERALN